jgi:uncharacterized protein YraI
MKKAQLFAATILATLILPQSAAIAQTTATATTDLNIRSGPGPQFPIVGMVGAGEGTNVTGCLQGSKWCTVMHNGMQGWAYSDYLTAPLSGSAVVLTDRYAEVGLPVVTYKDSGGGEGMAMGAATGAVAGAIVGGPVGAVVGGAIGGAAGGTAGVMVAPPQTVRTYVTANRTEPVFLEGEVVVGAGLPETVSLQEIPDYQYRYVYVNGQPVLVDPATRRIVHIVR